MMEFREWLRGVAKTVPRLRKLYLYLKLFPEAEVYRRRAIKHEGRGWEAEMTQATALRRSGLYDLNLPLSNDLQPFEGRNFLGYPAAGAVRVGGKPSGWYFGSAVETDGIRIPSYQATTDLEVNFPFVFDRYRPEVAVDFGTAAGASSVLFSDLMGIYSSDHRVLTVDINDALLGEHGSGFRMAIEHRPITAHIGDAVAPETIELVRNLLEGRRHQRALISFDDDHSAAHVFRELQSYAPLLKEGDVIMVQDTWDQGLRHAPVSALLAVLRFLEETNDFELDHEAVSSLDLPCAFVHGLLVKRGSRA